MNDIYRKEKDLSEIKNSIASKISELRSYNLDQDASIIQNRLHELIQEISVYTYLKENLSTMDVSMPIIENEPPLVSHETLEVVKEQKLKIPKIKVDTSKPKEENHNNSVADVLLESKNSTIDIEPKALPIGLNDKFAFIQALFNGDLSEYESCISQLQAIPTQDAAKLYLSELYHNRNWKSNDEEAQRLWQIVEHKFNG